MIKLTNILQEIQIQKPLYVSKLGKEYITYARKLVDSFGYFDIDYDNVQGYPKLWKAISLYTWSDEKIIEIDKPNYEKDIIEKYTKIINNVPKEAKDIIEEFKKLKLLV